MASLLNMSQELFALARRRLQCGDIVGGTKCLGRLLEMPNLPVDLAAQANFLWAQAAFDATDYAAARKRLSKSLARNPNDGEAHYLLARAHELDEAGSLDQAGNHYRRAHQLTPDDPRKTSGFGRFLLQQHGCKEGLTLLQAAYRNAGNDPEVVENFVSGLIAVGRDADAELVVAQAAYRNPNDQRFLDLHLRIRGQLLAQSLGVDAAGTDGASQVLQYRNLALSSESASPPRARRRTPAHTDSVRRAWQMDPVRLRRTDRLAAVLKTLGHCYAFRLCRTLSLGECRREDCLARVVEALLDPARLKALVAKLPNDSRRVLRTLVKVGGVVPASVLCQNTGPEAPPPDYLQPLAACGLIYFSAAPQRKNAPEPLLVVIPGDLCQRLAKTLRLRLA